MANGGKCDALVLLSALVSIEMSARLTTEQLGLLSAFFEALGDDLALLALCPRRESGSSPEQT